MQPSGKGSISLLEPGKLIRQRTLKRLRRRLFRQDFMAKNCRSAPPHSRILGFLTTPLELTRYRINYPGRLRGAIDVDNLLI